MTLGLSMMMVLLGSSEACERHVSVADLRSERMCRTHAKLSRKLLMWPLYGWTLSLQPLNYKYQPSRCCPIIAFIGLMDASWAADSGSARKSLWRASLKSIQRKSP